MRYISWDDWKVYGLLASGRGGEAADILRQRRHYRCIYETKEMPMNDELDLIEEIGRKLDDNHAGIVKAFLQQRQIWRKYRSLF